MKPLSLATAIVLSLSSACAFSQGNVYTQVNVAHAMAEIPNEPLLDTTGWGLEGVSGIFINEWLSLEANTSVNYYDLFDQGGFEINATTFSLGVAPKVHFPLASTVTLYAKAGPGVTMTHYSKEFDSGALFDYDSSWEHTFHLNVEAGVEFMVIPQLGLNLAYAKSFDSLMIEEANNSQYKFSQSFVKAGFTYYY